MPSYSFVTSLDNTQPNQIAIGERTITVKSANGTLVTSGTKVALASVPTFCDWYSVSALGTNGGILYLGGSTVSAASLIGFPMSVGDSFLAPSISLFPTEIALYDLSQIFIDGDTNGDKFTVVYAEESNEASLQNLVDAINANPATAGIGFSLPTQENSAFNAAVASANTLDITAKTPGAAGNTYTLSDMCVNFSWSGSHATGGSDGATTALTIGVSGSAAGSGLLYTRGSQVVLCATAPAGGTSLYVAYYRLGADYIALEDSALVAERAAIEHGTGKYEMVMTDTSNADPIAGSAEARQALTQFSVLPVSLNLTTYKRGLRPGQFITLALVNPPNAATLVNGQWQVHSVNVSYMAGQNRMMYTITVTSDTIATLISFYESLTGQK